VTSREEGTKLLEQNQIGTVSEQGEFVEMEAKEGEKRRPTAAALRVVDGVSSAATLASASVDFSVGAVSDVWRFLETDVAALAVREVTVRPESFPAAFVALGAAVRSRRGFVPALKGGLLGGMVGSVLLYLQAR